MSGQQDEGTGTGLPDSVDTAMRPELLEQLGRKRDELIGQLGDLAARAEVSRQAVAELLAERLRILGEGGDAVQLRDRLATARQDLDDWETSAGLVQQQIAIADRRIAEVGAEQQLAELRAQLAPAVADRDAAVRATGGRMAAAVLKVRQAAEEFAAALTDESSARDRAELLAAHVASLAGSLGQPGPDVPAEPESTILAVRPDVTGGPELALRHAIQASVSGHAAKAVALHLAEADGYLPPTRAEQAAEAELARQRYAETDRVMRQPVPAPQAWKTPWASSVDLDEHGNPLSWAARPPIPPHPLDAYRR